jgi:hypothetical protein
LSWRDCGLVWIVLEPDQIDTVELVTLKMTIWRSGIRLPHFDYCLPENIVLLLFRIDSELSLNLRLECPMSPQFNLTDEVVLVGGGWMYLSDFPPLFTF